jgi:hypothetical protein
MVVLGTIAIFTDDFYGMYTGYPCVFIVYYSLILWLFVVVVLSKIIGFIVVSVCFIVLMGLFLIGGLLYVVCVVKFLFLNILWFYDGFWVLIKSLCFMVVLGLFCGCFTMFYCCLVAVDVCRYIRDICECFSGILGMF